MEASTTKLRVLTNSDYNKLGGKGWQIITITYGHRLYMHGSLFNFNRNSGKTNKKKSKRRGEKGWNHTRAPFPAPPEVPRREGGREGGRGRRWGWPPGAPRALSPALVLKGLLHSGGTALAPAAGGAGSRGTGRGAQHRRAGPPERGWGVGDVERESSSLGRVALSTALEVLKVGTGARRGVEG